MEFTPIPTENRRLIIDRVPANPNPVRRLQHQTPQERMRDIGEVLVRWRGREVTHNPQASGG